MEKECKKHGLTHYKLRTDGRHRCSKCASESVIKRRKLIKQKAVDYKSGKCEVCGYNKCIAALEFHHKNPLTKNFAVGLRGATRSWEKVKNELDKCIMVCANCHREIHEDSRVNF